MMSHISHHQSYAQPRYQNFVHFSKDIENTTRCDLDLQIKLWPNDNHMLRNGIMTLAASGRMHHSVEKIIFVDFNVANLKIFLNTHWASQFRDYKIVLICDRHMLALATFWFYHPLYSKIISAIIFTFDKIDAVGKKIDAVLDGKSVPPARSILRLSFTEFLILQLISLGVKIKEIAYQCNYNAKTVYTYKNRIERKMNIRLPKA
ncbi:helix-turn-helix transcriptional regulator [uncultured Pluralibacter sp.]|uniref:helix-turn-helix domain-containing protein n=1 Tax=uncultured Pluralibacter sp. TaxID=1490864 RepID=UPI00260ADA8A|nr:helix-turn-helix transcriptional regulator [uncultured Pluralibacter sp.]